MHPRQNGTCGESGGLQSLQHQAIEFETVAATTMVDELVKHAIWGQGYPSTKLNVKVFKGNMKELGLVQLAQT